MSWIGSLGQDARFALRLLAKERWFTAASTAALALGIGVTGMMVTIINGYNFRGLPGPDPGRIVHLGTRDSSGRDRGVSYLDFQDWRNASRSFASLGAFAGARITISEPNRSPESLGGAYMSAESFGILGVAPMLGRGLSASDDRPRCPPSCLDTVSVPPLLRDPRTRRRSSSTARRRPSSRHARLISPIPQGLCCRSRCVPARDARRERSSLT